MAGVVVLGRDGVINEDAEDFIKSAAEWRAIPGSLEAIARLNRAGIRVVIATNQSGIKRRKYDVEALNLIHDRLHRELALVGGTIEAIFFCPCLPKDNCECYKPNPGMLTDIGERLAVDLKQVPVIGDSLRDVQAALAAGAIPMLVLTGSGQRAAQSPELPADLAIFPDLAAAVDHVLAARLIPA